VMVKSIMKNSWRWWHPSNSYYLLNFLVGMIVPIMFIVYSHSLHIFTNKNSSNSCCNWWSGLCSTQGDECFGGGIILSSFCLFLCVTVFCLSVRVVLSLNFVSADKCHWEWSKFQTPFSDHFFLTIKNLK